MARARISNRFDHNTDLLHAATSSVDPQALACALVAVDRHYQGDHTGYEHWLNRAGRHGLAIHMMFEEIDIDGWPEGTYGCMWKSPDGTWYAIVNPRLEPEFVAHITSTMIASAASAPASKQEMPS